MQATVTSPATVLLSLDHVAKTHHIGPYEKRTIVDLSLALRRGELVGVWGAQRAGKSTLLRLAAGIDAPDHGCVRFDGRDLAGLSRSQLGDLRLRDIGVAFGIGPQSTELTIADYVALPLLRAGSRGTARRRARDVLDRTGIVECRDATWSQLSDTEQVLASLAHALVRRPRLLLVDDPTLRLDTTSDFAVVALLRTLAEDGTAVLMTTSSMAALRDVHCAFTLSDGRLSDVSPARASVISFPGNGSRN